MKLYEISEQFQGLFDRLDDFSEGGELEQAWFDTLDGIEEEFEGKAENVAVFIKRLIYEAEALANEEKLIKARKEQKRRQADGMKKYLLEQMRAVHRNKIDKSRAVISVRNNAESVVIEDENKLIDWAETHDDSILKYKKPEISKTAVKQMIQAGRDVPCVHMTRTQSIIIK